MMSPIRVIFPLLMIVLITKAKPENNLVSMLTSNEGEYKTEVNWKIENFLEMPYAITHSNKHNGSFFKSKPFPAQSPNGVTWQFYIEQNGSETITPDNDTSIKLILLFNAPENIYSFEGSCRCGILSANGTEINEVSLVKEVTTKDPFVFSPFVNLNQLKTSKDLLPNGHLTVQCIIEGQLKLNLDSTNDVISTKITVPMDDEHSCRSKIVQENLEILSNFDNNMTYVINLDGSGRYHYINRDILFKSVPYELYYYEWRPSPEDFGTYTEVEDFLNFALKGDADNLEETCPRLYKVAEKFNFQCLKIVCQKILYKLKWINKLSDDICQ